HQVYYHLLGTPQTDDDLVFADRSKPDRGFSTLTSSDERFLFLQVWESTSGTALYFKDLSDKKGDFTPIYEGFDADFTPIDNLGDQLLILTNYKANNNRLISISSKKPEQGYWEELLSEQEDKLDEIYLAGGKIVAAYLHHASSQIKTFDLNGRQEAEVALPGIGTIRALEGQKSADEVFYTFTSFTRPNTIYRLDLSSGESTLFKAPNIDFDVDAYETKQVWYKSYDGTSIPMFITHKKGLKLDGQRPTLLYAYGGFDISILPQFNLTRLNLGPIFLENGGVYAVANLRGGGEFGKEWHKAGTLDKKQNVFNDFQAAAEYLIDQKYTSSEKLAIYGRSNGGLLIGACMTQRPDLYGVALPAVGVLDMLRYHQFTIGRAWATDYGLSENEKAFDYLYAYSPLHNAVPEKYPATMITTADHDDRVVPAHSFKFAAALQENQKSKNPVLIRVENSAGHGAGKPTAKKIEEATDILSFSFYNLKENVVYEQDVETAKPAEGER
ncbi:MAG: prolyl oligopeptidase family serine peptidase, partial [Bacteroidota bacterium]